MSAQQCLLATTDPRLTRELNQVFPFTIVPVTYSLPGLMTIRGLIMQGTIYAMRDRGSGSGNFAAYSSIRPSPTIRVGFDEFEGQIENRKGLLLHECIHAMQDNRAATWMRVDTAEAAAYTAQCLFHRACGTDRVDLNGLVEEAWDGTELILQRTNRTVEESEIQSLLDAIRVHPTYQHEFNVTGRYDGIRRPPQPPPQRSGGCSVSGLNSRSVAAQLTRILGL